MSVLISNGVLLTEGSVLRGYQIVVNDGRIQAILPPERKETVDEVIDADGMFVTPGLIDVHIHGSNGHDTMDASDEALAAIGRFLASRGVTSYLPTTVSASSSAIQSTLESVQAFARSHDGAAPLGAHLEGPYLNPDHKGAQSGRYLRDPAPEEYEPWLESSIVRLITLAPERDGVEDLLRAGIQAGVRFAVGHSGASYEQVLHAVGLGVTQSTHTFNAMLGLHHRRPGTVGAVLTDERVYAQVIADGVHLHPATVDFLIRCKGLDRTILITDAMRAAGLGDGVYRLGRQTVEVRGGEARLPSGSLAGSTLTLDAAVRNSMKYANLTFAEAVHMATYTPALAMGWLGKKGTLRAGADADIALFDSDHRVRMTMVGGDVVFDKR